MTGVIRLATVTARTMAISPARVEGGLPIAVSHVCPALWEVASNRGGSEAEPFADGVPLYVVEHDCGRAGQDLDTNYPQ